MRFSSTAPSAASSLRLGQNLLDRLGPHRPANRRNRAERAPLVAPFADSQISVMPRRQPQSRAIIFEHRQPIGLGFASRHRPALTAGQFPRQIVIFAERNARAPAGDFPCRGRLRRCARDRTRRPADRLPGLRPAVWSCAAAPDSRRRPRAGICPVCLHRDGFANRAEAIRSSTLRETRRY